MSAVKDFRRIFEALDAVVTTQSEDWALQELYEAIQSAEYRDWYSHIPEELLYDASVEVSGKTPESRESVYLKNFLIGELGKRLNK